MENKINIAEILKDCPKGMELYSTIFGEVKFSHIDDTDDSYPIWVENHFGGFNSFSKEGCYDSKFPVAECLLFPSSEMRDWSKFFKRGDVLINLHNGCGVIFKEWEVIYKSFKVSICQLKSGGFAKRDEDVFFIKDFNKVSDEQRGDFIAKLEDFFGRKYNPETLQVEPVKVECPFKPFDKVLVRNCNDHVWIANYFSHCKDNNDYHYVCIERCYRQCIPYNEHTAHLVGTTAPYTEGGSE